jgi:hypothetical protein
MIRLSIFCIALLTMSPAQNVQAQNDLSPPGQGVRQRTQGDTFSPNWAKPSGQNPSIPYRDPSSVRIDKRSCSPSTKLDGRTGNCR